MTVSASDLREQVYDLAREMCRLTEGDAWLEDLEVTLSVRDFTEPQIAAMKAVASPTCLQAFNALSADAGAKEPSDALSQILTHALRDPVLKAAKTFEFFGEGKLDSDDPDFVLTLLVQVQTMLREVVHNYPLLLQEDMPGNVQKILDGFAQDILPRLDRLVSDVSALSPLDPHQIPPGRGWEHLYALPPEAF